MKLSGIDIAYRESDMRDGRPIVFVHANSSSKRAFAAQFEGALARAHRLVAFDLPGHGDSTWDSEYSIDRFTEILSCFEASLRLRDAVYVGHSLGGHLLLQAWNSLHGSALAIFGTPPLSRPPRFEQAFRAHPGGTVFLQSEISNEALLAWEAGCFATPGAFPFASIARSADPRMRTALRRAIEALSYRDEREILRVISTPVAIIHAELDALINPSYLQELDAPTAWGRHVHVVPGAGHYPQIENSDAFDEILLAFAADL